MAWFRNETDRSKQFLQPTAAKPTPRRIVLRGRIVTMDARLEVIQDGNVLIEDHRIMQVSAAGTPHPPPFSDAPQIDTRGTIYPGLIDLHNHPAYNAIPLWTVPGLFANRSQWRSDNGYKRHVSNPAALLTHNALEIYPKAVVRFVECRSLLGGVTTTQGLSFTSIGTCKAYYEGLVRNVEFPSQPGWPVAEDYINDFNTFDEVEQNYGKVFDNPQRPYLIHLAEGTDQQSLSYFANFKRPDGSWLIAKNLIAIHATALGAPEFKIMANSGGIVWSPLSNLLLYGDTTKVKIAVDAGVSVAIGSDWGPSGTKNLLGELKIAKHVSDHSGGTFTARDLARMVTCIPAAMVGWNPYLGSIEAGKIADLLIIDGTQRDPYEALISATESDIIAVLIDGQPRVGRATVIDPRTPGVELLRIADHDLVLDIIESPAHPLANTRLADAISTLSWSLEHLPELATQFSDHHELLKGAGVRWMVQLDTDDQFAMDLVVGKTSIGPGDVDPMKLDPIAAVDDVDFAPRLRANPNLPAWLKQTL